uniref:Cilia- and flagella-associated protein 99 isoform X1 n=2 Tax=Petromyzon marinus TaxID=7757 RepID=A0AAJ7WQD8_PETMA|nr:cilia- and flagella-associated protein 99 isoform X1 [Petromyzon marinus]
MGDVDAGGRGDAAACRAGEWEDTARVWRESSPSRTATPADPGPPREPSGSESPLDSTGNPRPHGAMGNYGELIGEVVALLDKITAGEENLMQITDDIIQSRQGWSEENLVFLLGVLGGCVEQRRLLAVVVNAFYARHGKHVLLKQRNVFTVIAYLAVFRLEELGMTSFTKIINSQDIPSMHKFLTFLFDEVNLSTWMKDEWSQLYDITFVQNNLLAPLLKSREEVLWLTEQLRSQLDGTSPPRPKPKTTEPQEFSLTKPKPRTLPLPDRVPSLGKPNPVPKSTYHLPKEMAKLQDVRQRNRRRAERNLMEASKILFQCANAEKADQTKRVMAELAAEMSRTSAERPRARSMPKTAKNNVPIKLNTTAILREGAFYQARETQELKRLEELVRGARDGSEFADWQERMRQRDASEAALEEERRRLEGKLSLEEAVLARHALASQNQHKAATVKQQTAEMMQQYADRRLQEEKEMKKLIKQIMEGHENSKAAKLKLQEYKQKIVQEVMEESQELLRQALERAQEDMCRRQELIQQIRALEAMPALRHSHMDPTQTAGHALLSEMSLVELRERLALLKEAQLKAKEERRDDILREKQAKEQLLLQHLDKISLHRASNSKAAALRLEEKRARQQAPAASPPDALGDPKLSDLLQRLEDRRAERKRVTQSGREGPGVPAAVPASKKSQEHWQELERSRERQAQLLTQGAADKQVDHKHGVYQAARVGANAACITRTQEKISTV